MKNTVLVLNIRSKAKSKNGYYKFIDIIANLRARGEITDEQFQMFTKDDRVLAYRTASKIYIVFNREVNLSPYKSFAAGTINIIHDYKEFEGVNNNGTAKDMPSALSSYIQRYGK